MNSKEKSELRDNFIFANTAQFLYFFHEIFEIEALPPFVFFSFLYKLLNFDEYYHRNWKKS